MEMLSISARRTRASADGGDAPGFVAGDAAAVGADLLC
jgi:hypothetical protein